MHHKTMRWVIVTFSSHSGFPLTDNPIVLDISAPADRHLKERVTEPPPAAMAEDKKGEAAAAKAPWAPTSYTSQWLASKVAQSA